MFLQSLLEGFALIILVFIVIAVISAVLGYCVMLC